MIWRNKSKMSLFYFCKRHKMTDYAKILIKEEREKQSFSIPFTHENPWNIEFCFAFGTWDSSTEKAFVACHFTEQQKRDIEEFFYVPFENSIYDCTGSVEQVIEHFFEVPEGTWIYKKNTVDC